MVGMVQVVDLFSLCVTRVLIPLLHYETKCIIRQKMGRWVNKYDQSYSYMKSSLHHMFLLCFKCEKLNKIVAHMTTAPNYSFT